MFCEVLPRVKIRQEKLIKENTTRVPSIRISDEVLKLKTYEKHE